MIPPEVLGIVKGFVDIVASWWQRRQQEAGSRAEVMAAIIQFQLDERRLRLEATNERNKRAADWYPLGSPGRLRAALADVNQLVPRVLVCQPPNPTGHADVPGRVAELLREFDESGRFCHLVTDVLVDPVGRPIRGETVAREVALAEFDPSPSVIIYTERIGGFTQITAQLSGVFGAADGRRSIAFPLARRSGDIVEAAWVTNQDGHLEHRWRTVDSSDIPHDELFGAVVSTMTIGLLRLYWGAQGVNWRFSEESDNSYSRVLEIAAERCALPSSADPAVDRLFQEIAVLEGEYGAVTAFQEEDDLLALRVAGSPEVFLELSRHYPTVPPVVWLRDEDRFVTIAIDPAGWTPDRCLVEVVRGVRDEQGG